MATDNPTTHYELAPDLAASLRVQKIKYKDDVVPHSVIESCLIGPLNVTEFPELAGDVPLDRLLQIVEQSHKQGGA